MREKIEEIVRKLEELKPLLRRDFGVKSIGVFGSYVRNEQKETSDVDILVDFHPDAKMDLIKFVELKNYLSDLLGLNVDLVMKTALKSNIGKRIMKEVIYI